jgi:hypothetical protein
LFYNFSGLSNKLKQNKCWGRERFSGERGIPSRERERDIFRRDLTENPLREGRPAGEGERFDDEIRQRFHRERLSGEKKKKREEKEEERERTGLWRREMVVLNLFIFLLIS